MMLEGGGDDVHLSVFLPDRRRGSKRLIIRLAAAGGKQDLSRLGIDHRRDVRARLLQRLSRLLTGGIKAGGIAVNVFQRLHHH